MSAASRPGSGRGRGKSVVVFSMPETGHFQRLRPLIAGLAGRGLRVHVLTHLKFRELVGLAGGIFFDLFSKYPIEAADDESLPVPSRFVTHAGKFGEDIRREVERIGPSLILHDTFAVIGRVVAQGLGLPRVNVCAGHNMVPARYLAELPHDPRVRTSPKCLEAVKVLKEKYGLADASPFSYVSGMSPQLNIYGEPPEFLPEENREPFEPVAFFGSLPSLEEIASRAQARRPVFGPDGLRVYVSFGTIIWRYFADRAMRALALLADTFSGRRDIRALISLGQVGADPAIAAGLTRPNVAVENWVDQWAVLGQADLFITHHGLSSTHEAIYHRVPMISHPFFTDQPELAAFCQGIGLAVPLIDGPGADFDRDKIAQVFDRVAKERDAIRKALERARQWELSVIEQRPSVIRRIVDLME